MNIKIIDIMMIKSLFSSHFLNKLENSNFNIYNFECVERLIIKNDLFCSLPETMSKVHAFMYGKMSKWPFPTSSSKFSTKILILSLKIGINVCRSFKLNDGFIIFRIGFQIHEANVRLEK